MRKLIVALAMTLALLSTFVMGASAHSVQTLHVAQNTNALALSPQLGGGPSPDCNAAVITDLSGGYYSYRISVSCTTQVTRLASSAYEQYQTRQDVGWSTIPNSQSQSSCSDCSGLLNPGHGGIIHKNISGYPKGTSYQTKTIISWTFQVPNGTRTLTKTVTG